MSKVGEGEHRGDYNVVEKHRGQQSSRDKAVRIARQATDERKRKYRSAANARQAHGSAGLQRRPEQK
jgi:hypothetical protein